MPRGSEIDRAEQGRGEDGERAGEHTPSGSCAVRASVYGGKEKRKRNSELWHSLLFFLGLEEIHRCVTITEQISLQGSLALNTRNVYIN